MTLVIVLLLLALLLGGVGLFVEALRWVLIIALIMLILSFFSYGRRPR
ncbi:MAG: hydrophobic protein [Actinomycetota bacterium]